MKQQFNHLEGLEIADLQKEAHRFFYETMSCEINDALTSILAICESEGKEALPKIKQYIHRINQSLDHGRKSYVSNDEIEKFNISVSIKNILHAIKDRYKNLKLIDLVAHIETPVRGSQSMFERFFLYCFTHLFCPEDHEEDFEIMVELRKKGHDVVITVLRDDHQVSDDLIKKIYIAKDKGLSNGAININPQGRGVEFIMQIPFHLKPSNFKISTKEKAPPFTLE